VDGLRNGPIASGAADAGQLVEEKIIESCVPRSVPRATHDAVSVMRASLVDPDPARADVDFRLSDA
jgi:hypothetical protein